MTFVQCNKKFKTSYRRDTAVYFALHRLVAFGGSCRCLVRFDLKGHQEA